MHDLYSSKEDNVKVIYARKLHVAIANNFLWASVKPLV